MRACSLPISKTAPVAAENMNAVGGNAELDRSIGLPLICARQLDGDQVAQAFHAGVHKAGAAEAILKRQEEQDTETKKDGDTVVEISKTSGTTNDRKGFSWHKAGLLE